MKIKFIDQMPAKYSTPVPVKGFDQRKDYQGKTYTLLGMSEKSTTLKHRCWVGIRAFAKTLFSLGVGLLFEKTRLDWKFFWSGKKAAVIYLNSITAPKILENQRTDAVQHLGHPGEVTINPKSVQHVQNPNQHDAPITTPIMGSGEVIAPPTGVENVQNSNHPNSPITTPSIGIGEVISSPTGVENVQNQNQPVAPITNPSIGIGEGSQNQTNLANLHPIPVHVDAAGQRALGLMNLEGKNYQEALRCFQQAADQGDIVAKRHLGEMYLKGRGVTQNHQKAFEYSQEAADLGDAVALRHLGDMYLRGRGVTENAQTAFGYYQRAAAHGDLTALAYMGQMYNHGLGVDKNTQQYLDCVVQAAFQGNVSALIQLALVTGQDELKSSFFKQAFTKCKQNETSDFSQIMIGTMYWYGGGVKQDYLEGSKYLLSAAKQGNSQALCFLHEIFFSKAYDPNLFVEYLKQPALDGDAIAQRYLGICHSLNRIKNSNAQEGQNYIQRAADQGDLIALYFLGTLYKDDSPIKDDQKAEGYFKETLYKCQQTADKDLVEVQFVLGLLYHNGHGVDKDQMNAKMYLELAAKQGYIMAQEILSTKFSVTVEKLKIFIE